MDSLKERIQRDLLAAMRSRDDVRRSTLRLLTAAVKNAEIDARRPLDDAGILGVIQRQARQRSESIAEFERGKRPDLVAREQAELAVLDEYLPRRAGRAEIEQAARRVIAESGALGPRDIGKVMPVLAREFAGREDGREINETVRALLGG